MKEIDEKTFELNVTNELLNLSESFMRYLNRCDWLTLFPSGNHDTASDFLSNNAFFGKGLTKVEEGNSQKGGYDVSIQYNAPDGQYGRLLFLQYRSGLRKSHSNRPESRFFRREASGQDKSTEYVSFTFNDTTDINQYSTLERLARNINVSSNSVIYVFPRITEKTEFINKAGGLVRSSSFVPVLDVDQQASEQTPTIQLRDGAVREYLTSYDGASSEINYFNGSFFYENRFTSNLLAELVCIQIERFSIMLLCDHGAEPIPLFIEDVLANLSRWVDMELKALPFNEEVVRNVFLYLQHLGSDSHQDGIISKAPSQFTTSVPREGLNFNLAEQEDYSSVSYQLF